MGKITKIEAQKKNKDRVNIYIDNNFAFGVNSELIYKEGLKINLEVDEEKLGKVIEADNMLKCKETALKVVERSYKTEKEMKERLFEKGYDEKAIIYTLNFLKEYNFINDESYTKMYVKDRLRTIGSQKIKYDLKRKGIDENSIDIAISSIDKEEEKCVARELALKKYRTLQKRESDIYKLKSKLCRFLIGKGYDYSIAKDIINDITSN